MLKRIIISIMMLSGLFSIASANISADRFFEKKNDSSVILKDAEGYTFLYNKEGTSINNSSEAKISENLHKKICQNKDLKKELEKGVSYKYIYIFDDGGFLIEVSDCN